MFYGRDQEIRVLNEAYQSNDFQFISIFGRRRVGKTTLLKEFQKGKPGIFFTPKQDYKTSLSHLSRLVFGPGNDAELPLILKEIVKRSRNCRYLFIVDEYTRLTHESNDFPRALADTIKNLPEDSQLYIIICGSSVDLMNRETTEKGKPLYNMTTGRLMVYPLNPWDSFKALWGFSQEDAIKIWGMVDGIPYYLERFDPDRTLTENITRQFLNDCFFEDEAALALVEEYNKPAMVQSIVDAVANGNMRLSDIASYCGKETSQTSTSIKYLCDTGILEKYRPVDNPHGKSTRYWMTDHFLKFWIKRVDDQRDMVRTDNAEAVSTKILNSYDEDMDLMFKELCSWYLWNHHHGEWGTWWGMNPVTRQSEAIDAVVTQVVNGRRIGWFALCFYTDEPIGMPELQQLRNRTAMVQGYDELRYVLFSKVGFKNELFQENVELYTLDNIYNDHTNYVITLHDLD